MDDRFLYQSRPAVRPGFSENLYVRLSKLALQEPESKRRFKLVFRFAFACLLVFALLFTLSQPARASVLAWIEHIAGFKAEISTAAPVIDESKATVYYSTPQTLATALKGLSFTLVMPTYIPEGFVLNYDGVHATEGSISIGWVDKNQGYIDLDVGQNWDIPIDVGVDSTKEVQVNGQPAVLIRGWWDAYGKWDHNKKNLQLYWRKDGLLYILASSDPTMYREVVSEDELIRIAESIK
jgi:hypothetical protein